MRYTVDKTEVAKVKGAFAHTLQIINSILYAYTSYM